MRPPRAAHARSAVAARLAHSLKGVAANVYDEALRDAAQRVEHAARHGDLAAAATASADARRRAVDVSVEMRAFLDDRLGRPDPL